MKSEHRHELKTNTLADWMAHIPEWSQKNAKQLIGGTALVVLIVVAVLWSQYNKTVLAKAHRVQFTSALADLEMVVMQVAQGSTQGDDMSMNLGESSANLGELAKNASSATMAAMAYLKQAETLREQIQFESGQPTQETIADRIEMAKEAYNNVLKEGKGNRTLISLAQYGLGLCAEELGQFKEAATLYQALISDAAYKGTLGQASAINRIESMAYFDGTITFPIVDEIPEPLPPVITQTLDSNLVDPNTGPEFGPALPGIETAAPETNAVPAADVNVTQ